MGLWALSAMRVISLMRAVDICLEIRVRTIWSLTIRGVNRNHPSIRSETAIPAGRSASTGSRLPIACHEAAEGLGVVSL